MENREGEGDAPGQVVDRKTRIHRTVSRATITGERLIATGEHVEASRIEFTVRGSHAGIIEPDPENEKRGTGSQGTGSPLGG
jgi:hypothetical protein